VKRWKRALRRGRGMAGRARRHIGGESTSKGEILNVLPGRERVTVICAINRDRG